MVLSICEEQRTHYSGDDDHLSKKPFARPTKDKDGMDAACVAVHSDTVVGLSSLLPLTTVGIANPSPPLNKNPLFNIPKLTFSRFIVVWKRPLPSVVNQQRTSADGLKQSTRRLIS